MNSKRFEFAKDLLVTFVACFLNTLFAIFAVPMVVFILSLRYSSYSISDMRILLPFFVIGLAVCLYRMYFSFQIKKVNEFIKLLFYLLSLFIYFVLQSLFKDY